ncbi:MAG: hypothetical protein NWF00_00525 [Candidatus Bathyarchaeota archaeon]|nr:hypothetical protein [Candidatus Bathyarchaeota archaeon]
MSADKEKMDVFVEKIDELLTVLREVSDDLKTVSSSLKSLAVSQITNQPQAAPRPRPTVSSPAPRPAPTATPTAPSAPSSQTVQDVRMMFTQDLDNMLLFEDKGEYVMIKPKQFLGSENFAKIASTVRGVGGEYISAGRDSHFRVYKKNA